MYISIMSHFIDDNGNIAKEMHKEGRELASFFALLVDTATKNYPSPVKSSGIRCRKKKCTGTIVIGMDTENEVIEWHCTTCNEGGKISGWQGSKWDNRK
ncbi:MAG: hypothetical protein V1733_03440 [bacterium]